MARKIIVTFLAVLLSIGILRLHISSNAPSGFSYFGPETWWHTFEQMALRASQDLIPGFIIGFFLRSRQILTGAVVSAVGAGLALLLNDPHFWIEQPIGALFLAVVIRAAIYGSAASALGLFVLGSNKSFKADGSAAA